MVAVDIWVEGIADQKFLADVLKVWFGLAKNDKFECFDEAHNLFIRIRPSVGVNKSGGVSKFVSENGWKGIKPFFEEMNAAGGKNLIIADADEDFSARKKDIHRTVKSAGFDVESDLFLWPNNQPNETKGDLELLLEQIAHPNHHTIFECFDGYTECLDKAAKGYFTPVRKAKIFAYMEAILGSSGHIQENKRDYANDAHWVLNGEIEPLRPLKEFLNKHLFPTSFNIS